MVKLALVVAGVLCFGLVEVADADTILDTTGTAGGTLTLGNFSTDQDPLGQTFTIASSFNNLMIGGFLSDVNKFLAPSFDVTISLVSGAGVGGAVLGSSSFTLADDFMGVHIEDFSALGTISAGTYTVVFTSGATGRGALGITTSAGGDPLSDPYNEDGLFTIASDVNRDFRVKVTGDAAAPEPSAFVLLGMAAAGFVIRRRRKAS